MALTQIIRPDGEVSNSNWTGSYADIDEAHEQPAGAGDGNRLHTATDAAEYVMTFGAFNKPGYIVNKIQVWALIEIDDDEFDVGPVQSYYRIGTGSYSSAGQLSQTGGAAEDWVSATWSSLSLSNSDANNLQMKLVFQVVANTPHHYIDCLYLDLTYEPDTLVNADVIEGTMTQSEMGYAKGEFIVKEDVVIVQDMPIQITEEFTDHDGTSTEVIFDAFIQDHTLEDVQRITAVSKQDEIARIQPQGYYQGSTTIRLDDMLDAYKDFIDSDYGPTTATHYNKAPYNFYAQGGLTGSDIDFIDEISDGITATIEDKVGVADTHNKSLKLVWAAAATTDTMKHNFMIKATSGTIEFWWLNADCADRWGFWAYGNDDRIMWQMRQDNDWFDSTEQQAVTDGTWYRVRMDFDCSANTYGWYLYEADGTLLDSSTGLGMTQSCNYIDYVKFLSSADEQTNLWIDAWGENWLENYTIGDNTNDISYVLPTSTYTATAALTGGSTLQSLFTEGAMLEQYIWSIKHDGIIRWHDGTEDSGVILDGDSNVWNVTAKQQIKRINKVVLKGAGGLTSIKEDTDIQALSGQIIIFKDYRADIKTQSELDDLATSILAVQKVPPLQISLSLENSTYGWIQVGERIHIEASSIKYNNSSSYIPHDDYRVTSITYHLKDGSYAFVELTLQDGLHYIQQSDSEKIDHNTQNANYAYSGGSVSGGGGGGGGGLSDIVDDTTPQLGGDLDLNGFNLDFPTTANISDCLDEDNMASNSATKLATQQSIKAYADLMLPLTGGEMSGNITMAGAETVDGKDVSTLCTTAEAHAYVEANALTLEANLTTGNNNIVIGTGVIDSTEGDVIHELGRAKVGGQATDEAIFTHWDETGAGEVAIRHHGAGSLYFSPAGTIIVQPSGDTADYITISTPASVPTIATAGSCNLTIAPDGGTTNITGVCAVSGNITTGGTVDTVDIAALSITNLPTAVNNWKVFYTDGAGAVTELALGADETYLMSNGAGVAPSFEAVAGGGGLGNVVEDETPQLGGDLDLNGFNLDFPSTANISDCKDEDNMASNSATMLATQQSIKAYADARVSNTAFGSAWNGVTTIAPSKNAVYDIYPVMVTSNYGGNGSTGQTITVSGAAGLKVHFVIIMYGPGSDTNGSVWMKTENAGNYATGLESGAQYVRDSRINTMGTTSFVVDDDGSNQHPNKSGTNYYYVAFCNL